MNDNKRIVVNTGILYGKLVITTIIGLLSSRYILLSLGSSDFGLYSVVGGIVTFLNVIGVTMVSTSYRFLAVRLGTGDLNKLSQTYSCLSLIHWILALLLLAIGEIVGLYYINNYLVVAPDKLADAQFVFHVSLLTAAVTVINVPASGLTIAKEKFLFTSAVEIIVAIARLVLVILMMTYLGNRLRFYAFIMLGIQVLTTIIYQTYCYHNDRKVVRFRLNKRKEDYREIASFTGWSLLGATAYIGNTQGAAIIINRFFGTVLNAAYGIASQVNSYTNTFIRGITQAAVPQIMKSYGAGNQERSLRLVYIICRISSLALLLLFIPMISFTNEILVIWLKEPPEFAVEFVAFLLITLFISVLGSGFDSCIQSTGKIRNNEVVYALVCLIQLPIMFIAYGFGAPPYFNAIILCVATLIQKIYQIHLLSRIASFVFSTYLKETVKPVFFTLLATLTPIMIIKQIITLSTVSSVVLALIYEMWVLAAIYMFGLKQMERVQIIGFVMSKLTKKSLSDGL